MSGVILLLHPVHEGITLDEARAALPDPTAAVVPVTIRQAALRLEDMPAVNWGDVQAGQQRIVERELQPRMSELAGYDLAYFGLAPVPLAMHLGFLVQRWRRAVVYQRNHETRSWRWGARPAGSPTFAPVVRGVPQDRIPSSHDIILRLSVTARVDPAHTQAVVPDAGTEIDLEWGAIGEDVITTATECEQIASSFRAVMDQVAAMRPNARMVHLFAAVPTGLAFRLGTMLNATGHPRVQTYQYCRAEAPPHRRALILGGAPDQTSAITDEERAGASAMRTEWAEEVERLRRHLSSGARSWVEDLLPIDAVAPLMASSWTALAAFRDTALQESTIDQQTTSVAGDFGFDRSTRSWLLGDGLLVSIRRRLPDEAARRRAGRLLLLHEAIHLRSHRLTGSTATAIRRFPKVVEEVDYQADVWAILHELALNTHEVGDPARPAKAVTQIVRTAVETMWAFNDGADELDELEIRRVNRYLIWYWQWLRLERCGNLGDIARVLARKPTIELSGPRVRADGDRIFYDLRPRWLVEPELAVLLDTNRVVRHGHAGATSIAMLLEGLRQRNGDKVTAVLRSVLDQNDDPPSG